ncbi:MAG: zinc ribbon domain-containing protein, partial [Pyrinomonadaceae bacterium]|nr:zinc ribbon domain-containing protein [Pyrinomonadaceae bacterium]
MSATLCDNCGAPLLAEARFCRQCGKPQASSAIDQARLEAPTQTLGAREAFASPTEQWHSSPTTPAYLAPQSTMPPEAAPVTQHFQPPRKKSRFSLILLVTIFLLLLTSILAVGFVVDRVLRRPTVIVKHTESPGKPPAPDSNGGNIAIDQSLIYPG